MNWKHYFLLALLKQRPKLCSIFVIFIGSDKIYWKGKFVFVGSTGTDGMVLLFSVYEHMGGYTVILLG